MSETDAFKADFRRLLWEQKILVRLTGGTTEERPWARALPVAPPEGFRPLVRAWRDGGEAK